MARIYLKAYITLATVAASNDTEGCFGDTQAAPLDIVLKVLPEHIQPVLARSQIPHWTNPQTTLSKRRFPLLTCGWAFQERLLSPRILYCCGSEIMWEMLVRSDM